MIYIIVISYCDLETIQNLVSQYKAAMTLPHKIVVVDCKADEAIKEMICNDGCIYLSNGNIGYGKGFNYAIKQLPLEPSDVVLLSNDDVKVDKVAIDKLFAGYDMCSSLIKRLGPVMPLFNNSSGRSQLDRYENLEPINESISTAEFGPAALWLMSYDLIKSVGGFCPLFFMYAEDKEYIYRARHSGFTPAVVTDSTVRHDFIYPPKDKAIRLEKEINTISAHYLNLTGDKKNPHIVAMKGFIYSIITLQGLRLVYGVRGYLGFLQRLTKLKKIKKQLQTNPGSFLFIHE